MKKLLALSILLVLLLGMIPLVSSSPPVIPTAIQGYVFDNGNLITSGEVYCYYNGKDVTQKAYIESWGRYENEINPEGRFSILCLEYGKDKTNDFYVDKGSGLIKVNQQMKGGIMGEFTKMNLVIGECNDLCKEKLCSKCNSKWENCVDVNNEITYTLYGEKYPTTLYNIKNACVEKPKTTATPTQTITIQKVEETVNPEKIEVKEGEVKILVSEEKNENVIQMIPENEVTPIVKETTIASQAVETIKETAQKSEGILTKVFNWFKGLFGGN